MNIFMFDLLYLYNYCTWIVWKSSRQKATPLDLEIWFYFVSSLFIVCTEVIDLENIAISTVQWSSYSSYFVHLFDSLFIANYYIVFFISFQSGRVSQYQAQEWQTPNKMAPVMGENT